VKGDPISPEFARAANFAGMAAMIAVLCGAYIYQFSYRELPCTLCQLQRLAMLAIAFGAAMNVMRGPDPRHYGLCLIAAVSGLVVSVRQTLLHINPYFDTAAGKPALAPLTNPPFGQPVMGYHLYVWGIVLFMTVIFAVGIAQLFRRQFEPAASEPDWIARLAAIAGGLLFAIATLETLITFLECGIGECPNDGSWNWWFLRPR
jgi:disulfide bond formation protein DsbB